MGERQRQTDRQTDRKRGRETRGERKIGSMKCEGGNYQRLSRIQPQDHDRPLCSNYM